ATFYDRRARTIARHGCARGPELPHGRDEQRRRRGDHHGAERGGPRRKEGQRPDDLERRPDEDRREVHEGRPDETSIRDVRRFALSRNGAVPPGRGARSNGPRRTLTAGRRLARAELRHRDEARRASGREAPAPGGPASSNFHTVRSFFTPPPQGDRPP